MDWILWTASLWLAQGMVRQKGIHCTTWVVKIVFGVGVGRWTEIWGRWEMGSACWFSLSLFSHLFLSWRWYTFQFWLHGLWGSFRVILWWKWRISQGVTGWRHGLQSFRMSFGRDIFALFPPYILGCLTFGFLLPFFSLIGVIRRGSQQVTATDCIGWY